MTSDRSKAYGRAMKTIADLFASKLHPGEAETVRHAADSAFFCENLSADADARQALEALELLMRNMVDADRLLPETAGRLVADVRECGPLVPVPVAS